MRKIILLACVALLSTSVIAPSNAARAREADAPYNWYETRTDPSPRIRGGFSTGVEFETKPGETRVSISIVDATGMAIPAEIRQDLDGEGQGKLLATICGATDAPVRITPEVPVEVDFAEGGCPDGAPHAVSGKVTAVFTR